jgi:LysM repeat protein
VIVVIAATLGGGEDGGGSGSGGSAPASKARQGKPETPPPKAYVVQNGDTLTSIARETGVSVAEILRLNPGVDPQILISGEKLKLR